MEHRLLDRFHRTYTALLGREGPDRYAHRFAITLDGPRDLEAMRYVDRLLAIDPEPGAALIVPPRLKHVHLHRLGTYHVLDDRPAYGSIAAFELEGGLLGFTRFVSKKVIERDLESMMREAERSFREARLR